MPGAAVGTALTAEESTRVQSYVVTQRRPSIRVAEEVSVGQPLPPRVRLYPVPQRVGLANPYSYTVVNDRTVLVDPQTRTVVQVIDCRTLLVDYGNFHAGINVQELRLRRLTNPFGRTCP